MTIITVPFTLLLHRTDSFELIGQSISPGITGAGVMPLVSTTGGGFWQREIGDVLLTTKEQRQAWRAIAARCDGGANPLAVPFVDIAHQPWPLDSDDEPITAYPQITHSDGSTFSDESGYFQAVIDAEAVGAQALRSTSIVIHFNYGGPLIGGEHFSIEHTTENHHAYRIVTAVESGDDWICTIRPPLREAITDGTQLEFDKPMCLMRPWPPNSLHLIVDQINLARPSPIFLEHFL